MNNVYEEFIAKSRYARYLEEEDRRESWPESVQRYFKFMDEHLKEKHSYTIEPGLRQELVDAVTDKEILPSMRAIMTAGEALHRDNTAGYNCAYLAVDSVIAFDEAMYILLCGTGVGFSVERQYVKELPTVPNRIYSSDTTIVVSDSKEGWAKSLRQLIVLLYAGEAPKWDITKVRPAGARLKTFGGRASGPEPLVDLFKFVTAMFKGALGRKLTSLECHDLMCKIGEVVVVGGVRRSAMISLSNLSDERMRNAKSGAWWDSTPHRALANNSVCYTEKPDVGIFMQEWLSLYESKSGERGIFNRKAAELVVARNGRRKVVEGFGTNPCCVTGDTKILTSEGHIPIVDTVGKETLIWNGSNFASVVPYETGVADIYRVYLSDGTYIDCTKNHKFALFGGHIHRRVPGSNTRYREQKVDLVVTTALNIGDKLAKFDMPVIEGNGELEVDAYSQGFYSGDGCEYSDRSYVYEPKYGCIPQLAGRVLEEENSTARRSWVHGTMLEKNFVPVNFSKETRLAWLAGLLDADGTVTSDKNGDGIQLSSIDQEFLLNVKLLLTTLGINSKIQLASKASTVDFQDGYGEYPTKDLYRILIGNMSTYNLLNLGLECMRLDFRFQEPNRDAARFVTVKNVVFLDKTDMTYCFTEPTTGLGTFNGTVTGQSEIILRRKQFCNLTTTVVRAEDSLEDLVRKQRLSSILGTFQSTLVHFPYLSEDWVANTEEERLLGVSMVGALDSSLLNDYRDIHLPARLETMKATVVQTNEHFAADIGIPQSVATTAIKPEGTTSQLVDAASGLHARHSKFYYRRIRGDIKDPLTGFMIEKGIPYEPCVMKPDSTVVFTFPKKAPEGALLREDLPALDHLNLWLIYQRHYCEHKPSVTISVTESEWPEVGSFVWKYFDEMSGVSFLPYDGGSYRQAPYEECTEAEYNKLLESIPGELDWDSLVEITDNVIGSQTLACSADGCEIK